MHTEGCSVCIPIVITNFKVRGVKKDSVPYMMKIILTHISISVGLLTQMYIDSLIVLARPWSSLPMMLKFSGVVLCPVWVLCTWMDEASFRCSLYLSPKVLDVSPIQDSHTPKPNLTKGGLKALAELRKDSNREILTAEKKEQQWWLWIEKVT